MIPIINSKHRRNGKWSTINELLGKCIHIPSSGQYFFLKIKDMDPGVERDRREAQKARRKNGNMQLLWWQGWGGGNL